MLRDVFHTATPVTPYTPPSTLNHASARDKTFDAILLGPSLREPAVSLLGRGSNGTARLPAHPPKKTHLPGVEGLHLRGVFYFHEELAVLSRPVRGIDLSSRCTLFFNLFFDASFHATDGNFEHLREEQD